MGTEPGSSVRANVLLTTEIKTLQLFNIFFFSHIEQSCVFFRKMGATGGSHIKELEPLEQPQGLT